MRAALYPQARVAWACPDMPSQSRWQGRIRHLCVSWQHPPKPFGAAYTTIPCGDLSQLPSRRAPARLWHRRKSAERGRNRIVQSAPACMLIQPGSAHAPRM
jgi:hypothetical protein